MPSCGNLLATTTSADHISFITFVPLFHQELNSKAKHRHSYRTRQTLNRVKTKAKSKLNGDQVTPAAVVRDLGIFINSDVSMRSHVNKTVSACFAVLRQFSSVQFSYFYSGLSDQCHHKDH